MHTPQGFNGYSLHNLICSNNIMDIETFLEVALNLSQIIGQFHKNGIIYKYINPHNILIDIDTKDVKFVEPKDISSDMVGNLPYMSPEQTGRMAREIDFSTDFYSLGVTFYEMLTGMLPLQGNNEIELTYSHIAKEPLYPHIINERIPQVISGIIMKLLSKDPEDRYKNAYGLRNDLIRCMIELEENGHIEKFQLGEKDITNKLKFSEKLYGRDKDINEIIEKYYSVKNGNNEVVLISGAGGMGKSTLMNEIHRRVVADGGIYISGKCTQYNNNTPYSPVIQAITKLIKQTLMESQEKIEEFKKEFLKAVGNNGQIITDFVPEVEYIIGKQPIDEELTVGEGQNTFSMVFVKFIEIFLRKKYPIVFSLDDLQWIDSASLQFVEMLTNYTKDSSLLIIGTYREEEMHKNYILSNLTERINTKGENLTTISLKPFGENEVNSLICDTLHCGRSSSLPLVKSITCKTGGNPFFIKIFLESMVNEHILEFNYEKNCWKWDINKITKIKVDENSLNLLIKKIKKLPKDTIEILKLAACIGTEFDLKILSQCNEKLLSQNVINILPAIRMGIISPVNKHYSNLSKDGTISYINKVTHIYIFSHDHIHEQFYSMIKQNEKKEFHLKIGMVLLENVSFREIEGNVFEVVNQLNRAYELIKEEEQIYNLAKLNLEAGKKANASAAYKVALDYLRFGYRLLKEDSWETQYNLTYEICITLSEYECTNGDFQAGEELFNIVLENAKTAKEKAVVYNLKIMFFTSLGNFKKAVEIGLQGLKLFNISIPPHPHKVYIYTEIMKMERYRGYLKYINISNEEEIFNEKKIEKNDKEAIKKIFSNLKLASMYYNKNLFYLLTLKEMNFILKYGTGNDDISAYIDYAILLNMFFNNYKESYEVGIKALNRFENSNKSYVSKALSNFSNMIVLWNKSFDLAIDYAHKAYNSCLNCGESMYTIYCAYSLVGFSFMRGDSLDKIYEKSNKYLEVAKKIEYNQAKLGILLMRQLICNLKGETTHRDSLSNDKYDENIDFEIDSEIGTMGYHTYKLFISYIYGDFKEGKIYLKEAEREGEFYKGTFIYALSKIYASLTMTAIYNNSSKEKQKFYTKKLKNNLKIIKKWSENCPENFLSYYLLLKAEFYRVKNDYEKAERFYYKAMKNATKNGLLLNMSIISEIMGCFYKEEERICVSYIRQAYRLYKRWGATEKLKDLKEKYSKIFLDDEERDEKRLISKPYTAEDMVACAITEVDNQKFDLAAVIKASQAISGEIVLENLLEKLMKILIQNAGAQRGYLILNQNNSLIIEVEGSINELNSMVTKPVKIKEYNNIAKSVINYVARTKQNIVLKDASKENMFIHDAYIVKNNIKSVLCSPIINKGKFMGIIYLENNFATDVFSEQRLSIVNFLSSQAAISIENAYMYKTIKELNAQLEKKVEERTKSLNETMKYEELRTEFFANISHELRTPLNVIFGGHQMLELLIKNNMPMEKGDKIERYLATMKQNCYRLVRLINNLIDITKIDAGYFQVSLKNRNIVDIVEAITLSVVEYIENNGVNLIFDTDVEEKFIACDPDKIERIVLNLLSNALKFTNAGGNILVNMCDKGDKIVISVKDDGIGIPEEKQKTIFERFVQVDKSLSRNREGSGIGLSIVKSLIEMHGGRINLISEWGKGSEFIIELPNRTVEEDRDHSSNHSYLASNKIERIKIEFSDIYS
ncbi:ATP-binding protein [Clostridium ganghwense]|uniref:histidine kinase n=1 Tax=Clostridium ganghwense TaxID=312089 RepID=A0ABT4CJ85_9CLOT|nr:AAA family ATPase [Clostridium ganghwense]MCY6369107.1 AAA family ATPase [Clostridium ganghwense]